MGGFVLSEALDWKVSLPAPSTHGDPDAPLFSRLAAGDQAALGPLMARHGPRLRVLARRMTGRNDEAEDIVQEAFVAIWRRAARIDPDKAPIAAYLTRAVVNRCIDRARRQKIRRLIGLESAPEIEDDAPGADQVVEARGEMQAVARDLADLPARQRAAILLASGGDLTVAEVAAAMDLSVGATEQLLVRARRTLRRRALERMGADADRDMGP